MVNSVDLYDFCLNSLVVCIMYSCSGCYVTCLLVSAVWRGGFMWLVAFVLVIRVGFCYYDAFGRLRVFGL